MSDSPGRFRGKDENATGARQKADTKNKRNFPLPDSLVYQVPLEVGKTLRSPPKDSTDSCGTLTTNQNETQAASQCTVDPHGDSTLCQKEVASLIYMDVGRWSGSAPTEDDTQSHWGKHRDFGIVYGRLAALCNYTKDPPRDGIDGPVIDDAVPKSILSSPEFEKIRPLLKVLSSNPALGRVQVTKAVLGRNLNNETPKKDRIYVFLGDLHAPVITDPDRTYLDPPPQNPLLETGMAVQSIPGAHANAAIASGALKRTPKPPHGWWGRYDRGAFVRNLLPGAARTVGETAKEAIKADKLTLSIRATTAMASPIAAAEVIRVGLHVSAVLVEMAEQTRLREWPDPDGGDADSVKEWFERYHGIKEKQKGADIFEDAGDDLLLWLGLLKEYQKREGGKLPVRLAQLGDLFDFWIGLKCPFDLVKGARSFPREARAAEFVKYWMEQSLENPAIKYLWHFDKESPEAKGDLKTVFLYGNHDSYMGSLLPVTERLKARFEDDPGLVAQHGHQEDEFNSEENAGGGYLLTQAAFADDYVRGIEDPVSSLGPTLFGGSWTRLDLAEMALRTCIFDRVKRNKAPAMTFVMGHTHEPVLQVIHVTSDPEDKEKATSTSAGMSPSPSPPPSTSNSTATAASTATSVPPATPPVTSAAAPGDQSKDKDISEKIR